MRPVYLAVHDGLLFFSTALRILEALPCLPKQLDLRGVTELALLGYPLSTRSPYSNVQVLDAGEIVELGPAGLGRHNYWRWNRLARVDRTEEGLASALLDAFHDAVCRRLGSEREVVAFLSGGLDSRCIVASLRHQQASVHTINVARAGTQDLVFGRLAAEALGTRHFEYTGHAASFADRLVAAHRAWLATLVPGHRPPRPSAIWSGDGGSVGVGHVYLTEYMISLVEQGRLSKAVDAFLHHHHVALPRRLFVKQHRATLEGVVHQGIIEELERLEPADADRRLHLFLMLNDQRRHLAGHFEDLDLRRFELIVPFLDAEVVGIVLSSPVAPFLRHAFYTRWLDYFPPATRAAPWQTYPGHVPCPVERPEGLEYQWRQQGSAAGTPRARRRSSVATAERLLADAAFPGWLLNRPWLRLATWSTRLGLRDYGWALRTADVVARYATVATAAHPPRVEDCHPSTRRR